MYPRLSWPGVIAAARAVVARYDTRVTLRQLYYVLGAEGVIPLTDPTYRHLSAHLAEARRRGDFPKDGLIDLGREIHVRPRYADSSELLDAVPELYRADRTAGQPSAVYVGVEKDTLRMQITDWLEAYGIPVLVVRGYGSQTYADQVTAHVAGDGRPAVLLFVGDLDASGEDIERDWVARTNCWAEVRRLAVTIDQAEALWSTRSPTSSISEVSLSMSSRNGSDLRSSSPAGLTTRGSSGPEVSRARRRGSPDQVPADLDGPQDADDEGE